MLKKTKQSHVIGAYWLPDASVGLSDFWWQLAAPGSSWWVFRAFLCFLVAPRGFRWPCWYLVAFSRSWRPWWPLVVPGGSCWPLMDPGGWWWRLGAADTWTTHVYSSLLSLIGVAARCKGERLPALRATQKLQTDRFRTQTHTNLGLPRLLQTTFELKKFKYRRKNTPDAATLMLHALNKVERPKVSKCLAA